MKRFHVNMTVKDLDKSIRFYNELFATQPTVRKDDYAKWMLDDPFINFSISTKGENAGIDHIGIQANDEAELAVIRERLVKADSPILDEENANCCYANSKRHGSAIRTVWPGKPSIRPARPRIMATIRPPSVHGWRKIPSLQLPVAARRFLRPLMPEASRKALTSVVAARRRMPDRAAGAVEDGGSWRRRH